MHKIKTILRIKIRKVVIKITIKTKIRFRFRIKIDKEENKSKKSLLNIMKIGKNLLLKINKIE